MQTNLKFWKAETKSSPNSAKVTFDKGPRVAVHIEMKNGEVHASHLSASDTFVCTGADAKLLEWLALYSEGKGEPLPLTAGAPFQAQVMRALSKIPFGRTVSYKELAEMCDCPKGARAVGNACGRNPFPLFVPCHRVIHSDGHIGGFTGGSEIKKRLLEFERVPTK